MKRVLRWGILGAARISRALIPPIQSSSRHQLLAVASRDLERARQHASEWRIPRAYGSYEELLADPEIDAVYNPLPNHLHAEWTVRACQAGKHVLCEKPLALSLEEVEMIQAAAQKAGVVVSEAFMYRHHPQTLKVRELVAGGALGEVRLISGSFTFPLDRPADIRWDASMGGGSLWDIGCYPVSYTHMIAGQPPLEVCGWQQLTPGGVDHTFAGQMRYANGVLAQFQCSFALPVQTHMEIRGTLATLRIPAPFLIRQKTSMYLQRDGKEEKINTPAYELYLGEIDNLADAIFEGKPLRLGLDESKQINATLLALYTSARSGQPVRLG